MAKSRKVAKARINKRVSSFSFNKFSNAIVILYGRGGEGQIGGMEQGVLLNEFLDPPLNLVFHYVLY